MPSTVHPLTYCINYYFFSLNSSEQLSVKKLTVSKVFLRPLSGEPGLPVFCASPATTVMNRFVVWGAAEFIQGEHTENLK